MPFIAICLIALLLIALLPKKHAIYYSIYVLDPFLVIIIASQYMYIGFAKSSIRVFHYYSNYNCFNIYFFESKKKTQEFFQFEKKLSKMVWNFEVVSQSRGKWGVRQPLCSFWLHASSARQSNKKVCLVTLPLLMAFF